MEESEIQDRLLATGKLLQTPPGRGDSLPLKGAELEVRVVTHDELARPVERDDGVIEPEVVDDGGGDGCRLDDAAVAGEALREQRAVKDAILRILLKG